MSLSPLYVGIDIGSSFTKIIILNQNKEICGSNVDYSGVNLQLAAEKTLHAALPKNSNLLDVKKIVTTGFGRNNFLLDHLTPTKITEISCSAKAANYIYPGKTLTIIDIGGQDTKVTKIREGKRISFKMNRKCAAGTGTFLEELALKLRVSYTDLNELASNSSNPKNISSYCTVFAGTEILTRIREGAEIEDMVRGAYHSIVRRVVEIDTFDDDNIVVTGGVITHNPVIIDIFNEEIGKIILVPPSPQFFVALGAALFALEFTS
jgi:predicted CoA-substrate-specific enzyme activase